MLKIWVVIYSQSTEPESCPFMTFFVCSKKLKLEAAL